MNPEIVVSELKIGQRADYESTEPHDLLLICEQALGEGEIEIAERFYPRLNDIEQCIYQFRIAQRNNQAELAQNHLTQPLL